MTEDTTFDYVIVGAGSSGAVLANRLSADPNLTVCLIEAGPRDRSPFINVPLGVMWLSKDPRHNWLFTSSPQAGLGGRHGVGSARQGAGRQFRDQRHDLYSRPPGRL